MGAADSIFCWRLFVSYNSRASKELIHRIPINNSTGRSGRCCDTLVDELIFAQASGVENFQESKKEEANKGPERSVHPRACAGSEKSWCKIFQIAAPGLLLVVGAR